MRVLIVEDHTMIADYLASVLGAAGYEAIQAGSLAQANSLLAADRFDLWLCDRHLPDGDSRQLLARWSLARRAPAIALSADLDDADRALLLAAGFVEVLAKPCPPDRLLASVARALDRPAPASRIRAPVAVAPTAPEPGVASIRETGADFDRAAELDDAAGLRACAGNPETLTALRRLFAGEIAGLRLRLRRLIDQGDGAGLAGELHRLTASAAWCGAPGIARRARTLQAALARPDAAATARGLDQALQRLAAELAP